MKDVSWIILHLSTGISKGVCTVNEAKFVLWLDKKIYGDSSVPCEYDDELSVKYLKKLNEMVHAGIYSDDLIIHMAEMAEILHKKKLFWVKVSRWIALCFIISVILYSCLRRFL